MVAFKNMFVESTVSGRWCGWSEAMVFEVSLRFLRLVICCFCWFLTVIDFDIKVILVLITGGGK